MCLLFGNSLPWISWKTSRVIGSDSKFTIPLPLDSIVMFICATSLVENNALFPSYFFVGWTLVAILYWRQNQPDPWYRSIGFLESLWPLLTGTELKLAHNIKPDKKNQESIDEFNAVWERRYESS